MDRLLRAVHFRYTPGMSVICKLQATIRSAPESIPRRTRPIGATRSSAET